MLLLPRRETFHPRYAAVRSFGVAALSLQEAFVSIFRQRSACTYVRAVDEMRLAAAVMETVPSVFDAEQGTGQCWKNGNLSVRHEEET